MSARRKTTVAVVFGGRNVEHDVSIVTAGQIMRALERAGHEVLPVYISRAGRWLGGAPLRDMATFEGDAEAARGVHSLLLSPDMRHHGLLLNPLAGRFRSSHARRVDVVFPAIHGAHGEDGTLQGLLELADIPFVGCGTLASALAHNKILARALLRQHDIPLVDALDFSRSEWLENADSLSARILDWPGLPVFVKPATGGSSIGIARAEDERMLRAAIDVAVNFDRRVLVERALGGHVEINCAVLGNSPRLRASTLEQPLSWEDFLSYEDKYLRSPGGMKGAQRIIPAPLAPDMTRRIQELAIRAFRAIDGQGTARIDFFVKPQDGEIWLGEINTMPGSLAFYLWQEDGLPMEQLVDELLGLARAAHAEKRRNRYDWKSDLLALSRQRGLKGTKDSGGVKNIGSAPPPRD